MRRPRLYESFKLHIYNNILQENHFRVYSHRHTFGMEIFIHLIWKEVFLYHFSLSIDLDQNIGHSASAIYLFTAFSFFTKSWRKTIAGSFKIKHNANWSIVFFSIWSNSSEMLWRESFRNMIFSAYLYSLKIDSTLVYNHRLCLLLQSVKWNGKPSL